MASARDIKRRIKSVKNIRTITKALESVAAGRVRRAQQAVEATRPYSAKARALLASVASLAGGETKHPLLTTRDEIKNVLVLLVSGDRGLCGAFNSNVTRAAWNHAKGLNKPIAWVTMGKKGRELVYRMGGKIIGDFSGYPARPSLLDTTATTHLLIEEFLKGNYDEVYVAYTDFITPTVQRPIVKRLLPLVSAEIAPDAGSQTGPRPAYDFEPDPAGILNLLLPRLTEMQVYQALLESQASFYNAQRVAMRNATDSAGEAIGSLTLSYNKARQQAITNELLDISGGVEALKKVA